MCTVVCRCSPGEPVRILALRDEFVAREFDDPDAWWPEHPSVVGGRDRVAGGSWCVTDIATGVTALLVNRTERVEGTPSRGLLPLAAAASGDGWPAVVDHRDMAAFNLITAGPDGVVVWIWDAVELRRTEVGGGTHLITSQGVDAADPRTQRFGPQFDQRPWLDVVTSTSPSGEDSALVVRREHEGRTYATVFGQAITSAPGQLRISSSRTPWRSGTWTDRDWP